MEISPQEQTAIDLQNALGMTRMETSGITLQKIAEIIKEELDESEIKALIRDLLYES